MIADKYVVEAELLGKAIDIAIDAIQKHPPKGFTQSHVDHFVNVYKGFKQDALSPLPKYRNLSSLKYTINDVFIYFQEAGGPAVEYFWQKVKEDNLGYKRENKLGKILKRKKINNQVEYDFVVDVIVPYRQEGLITDEENEQLNNMIGIFEQRGSKNTVT